MSAKPEAPGNNDEKYSVQLSTIAAHPGSRAGRALRLRDKRRGQLVHVCVLPFTSVAPCRPHQAGDLLVAYGYDPRAGTAARIGTFVKEGVLEFTPPPVGPDWVLVLDDDTYGFPAPGSSTLRSRSTS